MAWVSVTHRVRKVDLQSNVTDVTKIGPLNPPILGDFRTPAPPKLGGGGLKSVTLNSRFLCSFRAVTAPLSLFEAIGTGFLTGFLIGQI